MRPYFYRNRWLAWRVMTWLVSCLAAFGALVGLLNVVEHDGDPLQILIKGVVLGSITGASSAYCIGGRRRVVLGTIVGAVGAAVVLYCYMAHLVYITAK